MRKNLLVNSNCFIVRLLGRFDRNINSLGPSQTMSVKMHFQKSGVAMKFSLQLLLVVGLIGITFQSANAQGIELSIQKVKFGAESTRAISIVETEKIEQEYQVSVPKTEAIQETYMVQVPYTENVTQSYTVSVPYTETVTQDDGTEEKVQKMRTEVRTRQVPVTRMRSEERTRMVPQTRVETVTKTRMVPVKRKRTETITTKFPPKGASFAFPSGEKIAMDKLEKLTSEPVPILTLRSNQELSELQRTVLKPDLIVMTLPPEKKKQSEGEDDESNEEAEKE